MTSFFDIAIGNALVTAVMALIVLAFSRVIRQPSLRHALWLVVLLKLLTPPLFTLPVSVPLPDFLCEIGADDWLNKGRERIEQQWSRTMPSSHSGVAPLPATPTPSAPAAANDQQLESIGSALVTGRAPIQSFSTTGIDQQFAKNPQLDAKADQSPGTRVEPNMSTNIVIDKGLTATAAGTYISWLPDLSKWFHGIWIVGVVAWFSCALVKILRFRKWVKNAFPAPGALQRECDRLADRMGVSARPQLLLVCGSISPMIWSAGGVPKLLFPLELLARLSRDGRETLLLHELAHIKRGDHWVRVVELFTTGIYWWHPAVWLARREIHCAEEESCDAMVLSYMSSSGRVYADALLETVDYVSDAHSLMPPAITDLAPQVTSGIGRVAFLKRRLTLIMRGGGSRRLNLWTRFGFVMSAVILLPSLPRFAGSDPHGSIAAEFSPTTNGVDPFGELRSPIVTRDSFSTIGENGAWISAAVVTPSDFDNIRRSVFAVACSDDGTWMASAHEDHSIRIRDANTGIVLRVFVGHTATIHELAFAPDGESLVSAADDGTIRVWDLATGIQRISLMAHRQGARSVQCSPDGTQLVSAGVDSVVRVWDFATGDLLAEFSPGSSAVLASAFAPGNQFVVAGCADGTVKGWHLSTGTERLHIQLTGEEIRAVAISPDGLTLAIATNSGAVTLCDLDSGKLILRWQGHQGGIHDIAYSPNAKLLATAGEDQQIDLREPSTGQRLVRLHGHSRDVSSIAFSPVTHELVSGGLDGGIQRWSTGTPSVQSLSVFDTANHEARFALFASDGKRLVVGGADGTVQTWDLAQETMRDEFRSDVRDFSCGTLTPDGNILVTGSQRGQITFWDLQKAISRTVDGFVGQPIAAMTISPDGKWLATLSDNHSIDIWDVNTQSRVSSLPNVVAVTGQLFFSSDGRSLMFNHFGGTTGGQGTIEAWDWRREVRLPLPPQLDQPWDHAVVGPDGQLLACADSTGVVHLFEAKELSRIAVLRHATAIANLQLLSGGRSLAVAEKNGVVSMWNLHGEPHRVVVRTQQSRLNRMSASADGQWLTSIDDESHLTLWRILPGDIPNEIHAIRELHSAHPSSDGRSLIVGGLSMARLYDLPDRQFVQTVYGPSGAFECVAVSDDRSRVAAAGKDGIVRLWLMNKAAIPIALAGHHAEIVQLEISPDGRRGLSVDADRTAILWDLTSGTEIIRLANQNSLVGRFSKDSQLVLIGENPSRVLNAMTGGPLALLNTPGSIVDVQFLHDGRQLVTAHASGQLELWDVTSQQVIRQFAGGSIPVTAIDIFPDDKNLVAANKMGTLVSWSLAASHPGRMIGTLPTVARAITMLADNRQIVAVDEHGWLRFRQVEAALATSWGRDDFAVLSQVKQQSSFDRRLSP